MTRRLTLTMVAVVTGALLVATLGTLFVTRLQARNQTRRDLGDQAQRLARRIETVPVGLAALRVALRLEDGAVICLGPTCPARQAVIRPARPARPSSRPGSPRTTSTWSACVPAGWSPAPRAAWSTRRRPANGATPSALSS